MIDEAAPNFRPKHPGEYCHICKKTTPHDETSTTKTCQICGSIGHKKRVSPAMAKLAEELDKVFMLTEDEPRKIKPEGTAHTSAEGAHRPDKGTKFIELKIDAEFSHKTQEHSLRF